MLQAIRLAVLLEKDRTEEAFRDYSVSRVSSVVEGRIVFLGVLCGPLPVY